MGEGGDGGCAPSTRKSSPEMQFINETLVHEAISTSQGVRINTSIVAVSWLSNVYDLARNESDRQMSLSHLFCSLLELTTKCTISPSIECVARPKDITHGLDKYRLGLGIGFITDKPIYIYIYHSSLSKVRVFIFLYFYISHFLY